MCFSIVLCSYWPIRAADEIDNVKPMLGRPLPKTLLSRFHDASSLYQNQSGRGILEPERTRHVTWVVAQNPTGWAFASGNALAKERVTPTHPHNGKTGENSQSNVETCKGAEKPRKQ